MLSQARSHSGSIRSIRQVFLLKEICLIWKLHLQEATREYIRWYVIYHIIQYKIRSLLEEISGDGISVKGNSESL